MTKLLLSSLTSLAFAASVGTALAQDSQHDMDAKADMKKSEPIESVEMDKTDVSDDMDDASDMKNEWEDDMSETTDEVVTFMEDETDEALSNKEMADCPKGSELQDDGSCEASEGWTPED